jgi:hypothetical protein
VGVAHDGLEMVLDQAGVLADIILGQIDDRLADQAVMRPEPGLAGADDPLVGVDAYEQATIHQQGRDARDLHGSASLSCPFRMGAL